MISDRQTRQTLLQKLQTSQDDSNWEEFIGYYEGYIYVVLKNFGLSTEDTQDLLQEVLLKVWKALPRYNYQEGKCRFRTWLCVVIRNTVFNFYDLKANRNKRKNVSFDEILSNLELISESEIDALAEREWQSYISNMAWDNLKGQFSDVLRQVFEASMDDKENAQIAEEFNIAESSVRVYKMRVRKALMKEIVRLNQELGG